MPRRIVLLAALHLLIGAIGAASSAASSASAALPQAPPASASGAPAAVGGDTIAADTARLPAGHPVVLRGDTLFLIRAPLGSFTAADRATAIGNRIAALAAEPLQFGDSASVVEVDGRSDVRFRDVTVLTVTESDARAAGMTRDALALQYATGVEIALRAHAGARDYRAILLAMLQTLLALMAAWLLLRVVSRAFALLRARMAELEASRIAPVRVQKLEIISASQLARALHTAVTLLRVAVTIALLYALFVVVFSFFPGTRSWAARLREYVATPIATVFDAIAAYLPNIFYIAVIVLVTWYALKLIRLVFRAIDSGSIHFEGFHQDWALPSYKIVRFLAIALAVIMIWPYLPGSDQAAFRGVAAFIGLLLTFGSASAVANVVGGTVMVYMRPFQVGDVVKIADTMGAVMDKNLLVTRVRTPKNVDITIPNSMVLNSHIINYSSSAKSGGGLVLHTTVTIGYDVPWRQVHELLLAAARDTDLLLTEPEPFVLQKALDDFAVAYEVNAFTVNAGSMARIYSELHANIQDRFNRAGVEIMSPTYAAVRDGSRVTLPDEHLPADYAPPPFRVQPMENGAARNR